MNRSFLKLSKLIFMFMISSFIGWIYEVSADYIFYGKYFGRGVLHIPFIPIYGIGMLLILLLFRKNKNLFLVFVGSIFITTILELIVSYIFEYCFSRKLWSYSDWPLNFQGRISLISSIIFGLFAVLFVKGIKPLSDKLFEGKHNKKPAIITISLFTLLVAAEIVMTFCI